MRSIHPKSKLIFNYHSHWYFYNVDVALDFMSALKLELVDNCYTVALTPTQPHTLLKINQALLDPNH